MTIATKKFAVVSTIDGRTAGPGVWWGEYIISFGETELAAAKAYALSHGSIPKKCQQIADDIENMSSSEILASYRGHRYCQLLPISEITAEYVGLICNNGFDMRVKIIDGIAHKLSNSDVTSLMTLDEVELLGRNFEIDENEVNREVSEFNSEFVI
jgi:hypothetical protein